MSGEWGVALVSTNTQQLILEVRKHYETPTGVCHNSNLPSTGLQNFNHCYLDWCANMDQNGLYLLLTIIYCSLALLVLTEPVNVALNKETNAIFTCATFGREYYRNLGNKDQPQEIHKCDSDATHPPSAMVDGDTTTKWQSVSKFRIAFYGKRNLTMLTPPGLDNLHAVIYIDLKQVCCRMPCPWRMCMDLWLIWAR